VSNGGRATWQHNGLSTPEQAKKSNLRKSTGFNRGRKGPIPRRSEYAATRKKRTQRYPQKKLIEHSDKLTTTKKTKEGRTRDGEKASHSEGEKGEKPLQ